MKTRLDVFFIGLVILLLLGVNPAWGQQNLPSELVSYADVVLFNGKVLTADEQFTIAEAVAIRDGKFLAIGADSRIVRMAGPETRKVDLQGKSVVPGFIDTHFHLHNYAFNPVIGGVDPFPVLEVEDLQGNITKEGLLKVLRAKASSWPRVEGWVVFGDSRASNKIFDAHLFHQVRKEELDEIFPNEPAALGASHGNNYGYYVLNSRGLEIILKKMSPDSGGIVKDNKTGEPTGLIVRPAASAVGEQILPWPDIPQVMELLKQGIFWYNATGRTTIQTKTPGFVMAALRELWSRGELNMRWRAQLKGFDNVGDELEGLLKRMGNLSGLGDPMLKISSGAGGVPSEAWDLTWDKPRLELKDSGPSDDEGGLLDRSTYLAAKYGWSIGNVHSQGDRSNDAYLAQLEEGMRDRLYEAHNQRFGLDHAQMITAYSPEGNQIERIANLGLLVPSLNIGKMLRPGSYARDRRRTDDAELLKLDQIEILEKKWGLERLNKMLPAKSLIRAGVKPSNESDTWRWPETYPPWTMEMLITRKDDRYGRVWGAGETVTREEALWMRTLWAADYTVDKDLLGSIEPGKLADLVILDQDYMTVPEDEISQLRVVMTLLNGEVVYDSERDGQIEKIYSAARGHWK